MTTKQRISRGRVSVPPATIDPTLYYNTAQMNKLGFGNRTIAAMRQSGIVRPRTTNLTDFYSGKQICEWIESQPEKTS